MSILPYIHLLVGFLLANLAFINSRTIKQSKNSPDKFSINFFIADNWQKWIFSVPMSFILLYIFLYTGIISYVSKIPVYIGGMAPDNDLSKMLELLQPFIIGFSPDFALGWFKKFKGFLQPKNVMGFNRSKKEEDNNETNTL